MKVKDITREGLEIKPAQPTPAGTMGINIDGKQVGTADAQTAQQIAQASKDGKLELDQTPDGSKTLGEEPSNSSNTVDAIKKGAQLIASDGDSIEITSTRKEVDQAYIAHPDNKNNRLGYVVFNGKKYLALNTGHKWKIGPNAFAEITGIMHLPATRNPAPSFDSRRLPLPNQPLKPSEIHKLEESAEVSRIRMLSGLK
jgi:hypothetical protein